MKSKHRFYSVTESGLNCFCFDSLSKMAQKILDIEEKAELLVEVTTGNGGECHFEAMKRSLLSGYTIENGILSQSPENDDWYFQYNNPMEPGLSAKAYTLGCVKYALKNCPSMKIPKEFTRRYRRSGSGLLEVIYDSPVWTAMNYRGCFIKSSGRVYFNTFTGKLYSIKEGV